MKNMKFFLQLTIFILLLANVDAATIYHPASEVTAGTFDAGDFTFSNNLYVIGSVRPSIMYDRDNTGYYVDPNSNSWLYRIYSYDIRSDIFYDRQDTSYYVDPNSVSYFNDIRPNIIYDRQNTGYYVDPNSNSWLYRIYSYDIRSSIFYDLDNTGYYVDPAGTSNFNTITLGGVSRSSWPSGDMSGSGSSNYIAKFTGSNTLGNSIIYDNGNVGIGTTSPSYKLDVDGDIRAQGWLRTTGGAGLYSDSYGNYLYPEEGFNYWTVRTGYGLKFYDGSWNRKGYLYYDGSGFGLLSSDGNWRVRTQPGYQELYGTTYMSDARSSIFYDRDNTGYYVDPASNSWLYRIYSYDIRSDIFYDRQDTSYYVDPNSVSYFNDIRPNIIYDRQNTGYYVDPNSNSWLYRIYSYDIRSSIFYDLDNTGYYVDPAGTSNFNTITLGGVSRSSWPSGDMSGSGSSNYIAKFTGSNTLGNSIIYDNGNVGIGTTGPQGKLTINNVADFDYYDSKPTITSERFGSLRFKARGGDYPDLVVATSGNVGIGTTSPSQKLDVAGNVIADLYYDRQNTGYYVDPNSNSWLYRIYSYDIRSRIFYDLDNTGYYLDPASTSRINYGIYNNVYSYGWMQAPIFYDANDNGYYLDPNSVSYLNDLRVNILYDRQNTGYYVDPAGTSNFNYIQASGGFVVETRTSDPPGPSTGRIWLRV